MANKLRAQYEGLGIRAIFAAVLAIGTYVKISADRTVNAAGADEYPLGYVRKAAKAISGTGTVETRCKELVEMKSDGAIAAGDRVKMAADDPAGTQCVKKWVSQTDLVAGDKADTLFGICWKGGADNTTVEILTF